MSVALPVAVVAAIVAAVLTATASAAPAIANTPAGHWIYDRVAGAAFHIDSGTHDVDAKVAAPDAGAVTLALQSQDQGFLVAGDRVTTFEKSDLTVAGTLAVPSGETPLGIETDGGPYLVFRSIGTVVRLGLSSTTIQVGGSIATITYSATGVVWLRRADSGQIERIDKGADQVVGVATTPPGKHGALVEVGDTATFVDVDAATIAPLSDAGLGAAVPLGAELPADAAIADHDAAGRLAAIAGGRLVLVDAAAALAGRPVPPVTVPLEPGAYAPPAASATVVAVLNTTTGLLSTYSPDGKLLKTAELGPGASTALLQRGADGSIYVDDPAGGHTHAIGADGSITDVRTTADAPVAIAPPPNLRASVRPPPQQLPVDRGGGPPPPTGGGPPPPTGGGPPPPTGGGPPPPTGGGPTPPDPCRVPGAPTHVTATPDPAAGTVALTWQPAIPDGCPVTGYAVTADGATTTVRGTSTTIGKGAAPGTVVTAQVAAVSDAGAGQAVPASATMFGTPAAPSNLMVSSTPCDEARAKSGGAYCYPTIETFSWTAPDLRGGGLDHYVASVVQPGHKTVTRNVTVTSTSFSSATDFQQCERWTMQVQAVTRGPGGSTASTSTGPIASVSYQHEDCTPDADVVSAVANADGTVAVGFRGAYPEEIGATCTIDFSGAQKWSGQCPMDRFGATGQSGAAEQTETISALTAGTTYSVTVTASNRYGTKTSGALSVTTPGTAGN